MTFCYTWTVKLTGVRRSTSVIVLNSARRTTATSRSSTGFDLLQTQLVTQHNHILPNTKNVKISKLKLKTHVLFYLCPYFQWPAVIIYRRSPWTIIQWILTCLLTGRLLVQTSAQQTLADLNRSHSQQICKQLTSHNLHSQYVIFSHNSELPRTIITQAANACNALTLLVLDVRQDSSNDQSWKGSFKITRTSG